MADSQNQKSLFDAHKWWFVLVGLLGNVLFFAGSCCFLSKSFEGIGTWLFILGSCFMLVSSAADSMAEFPKKKHKTKETKKWQKSRLQSAN
jgi:hypothetical protein